MPTTPAPTSLRARFVLFLACALTVGFTWLAFPSTSFAAGADAGTDAGQQPIEEPVAPDSPRAAVQTFLELCRRSQYEEAAAYLDLARNGDKGRGPELAQRLKAVLDRHAWIELEKISPRPEGDLSDKRPNVDRIAVIPGPSGEDEPVELERRPNSQNGPAWVFTRGTVLRIDGWFSRLGDRWLVEHLPAPLLRHGPGELLYWQWLAIPVMCAVAWAIGLLLTRATRALLRNLARRWAPSWGEAWLVLSRNPQTLFWALSLLYLSHSWLALYAPAERLVRQALNGGFVFAFFWGLFCIIDAAGGLAARTPWAVNHRAARMLLPLGRRLAKVVVFVTGCVALLSTLGYSVTALVAGLGLGGLALALAAQKTVENLFGAFSIALDQPFREGDFVCIDGEVLGTVERIGLRSTRIRTLDRTLVSLPNGKLAEMRLESYTARDRMRLHNIVRLAYGTTTQEVREVLTGIEAVLRSHPKIWPDVVNVRLKALTAEALEVEIMAWFQTSDWNEFLVIRQEVLLDILRVIEEAGVTLAFPTHTIHLAGSIPEPVAERLTATAKMKAGT